MASIKMNTNNKFEKGHGEKGTSVCRWWECKLVQPLWKKTVHLKQPLMALSLSYLGAHVSEHDMIY